MPRLRRCSWAVFVALTLLVSEVVRTDAVEPPAILRISYDVDPAQANEDWRTIVVRVRLVNSDSTAHRLQYSLRIVKTDGEQFSAIDFPAVTIKSQDVYPTPPISVKVAEGDYFVEVSAKFMDLPGTLVQENFGRRVVHIRPRQPRLFAVLVGLDAYGDKAIADLAFASYDVVGVYNLLTTILGVPEKQVTVLLNPSERNIAFARRQLPRAVSASRANIIGAIEEKAREVRDTDTFLVYFAGHGTLRKDGLFLLTQQSAFERDTQGRPLQIRRDSALWAVELLQLILNSMSQAQHVFVLLDACFSGKAIGSRNVGAFDLDGVAPREPDGNAQRFWAGLDGLMKNEGQKPDPSSSRYLLTASQADRTANEVMFASDRWTVLREPPLAAAHGHGLFTAAFLEAIESLLAEQGILIDLNGDGLCGRKKCPEWENTATAQEKLKSTKLPLDSVYSRLQQWMETVGSSAIPPIDQLPNRSVTNEGRAPALRYQEGR